MAAANRWIALDGGREATLIPWPSLVEQGRGEVPLAASKVVLDESVAQESWGIGRHLAKAISDACGLSVTCARGNDWHGAIRLSIDRSLHEQEYCLDISHSEGFDASSYLGAGAQAAVRITGGDVAGLRHGAATLRQLVVQCAPSLPVLHIEDHPAYASRGYYLDVTRGRVPTLDWLKQWADLLEECKYNQLQLYVEHSFAFDGMSETWRAKGAMSPETIMEFDEYCHERGIELVPSLSSFGHLYEALRTKGLHDLGELPEQADRPYSFIERQMHHTLNVTDPRSFALSCAMIDAYAPLFSSRKFNICGDETFDLGRGRSHEEAERVGAGTMYADYIPRLCEHVRELGREPMMWGDIAVSDPEVLSKLPVDVKLLNWQYSPDVTDREVALVAATGANQTVCPATQTWNRMLPSLDNAWRNINRLSKAGLDHGVRGFLLTDWGDYGHVNDPRMAIPALMYGAECSWTAERTDFESINNRIGALRYGDHGELLTVIAQEAEDSRIGFSWGDLVRYEELRAQDDGVNTDVLSSIWEPGPDWKKQAMGKPLEEVRAMFLRWLAPRLEKSAPGLFQHICGAIAQGSLPSGERGAFLLAAAGQELLDAAGRRFAADSGVMSVRADDPKRDQLAAQLEEWFEQYVRIWRSVSEESELSKIGQVIWRCADLLRAKH